MSMTLLRLKRACSTSSNHLFSILGYYRALVCSLTRCICLRVTQDLTDEYGIDVVKAYMQYIMANAEEAVRTMLCDFSLKQGLDDVGSVEAQDFLDDGSTINLKVTINRTERSAIFDFEGTDPEVRACALHDRSTVLAASHQHAFSHAGTTGALLPIDVPARPPLPAAAVFSEPNAVGVPLSSSPL